MRVELIEEVGREGEGRQAGKRQKKNTAERCRLQCHACKMSPVLPICCSWR